MVDSGDRSRTTWPLALIVALFACALITLVSRSWGADSDGGPRHVAAPDLSTLHASTTDATLNGAPRDPSPQQAPGGVVVHPKRVVPLWDEPDGTAFAKLAPEQFGDAWYPVIEGRVGWVRVLPSRPNGSTGWVRTQRVETRRTTDVVRVHLGSRRLDLVQDGAVTGTWPVAVGATGTPTPTGRTFILGQLVDDAQAYSPLILPLGTHSQTPDTYGGGPGTVALHGWPDPSVFGQAVSHGCVRVPADRARAPRRAPPGNPRRHRPDHRHRRHLAARRARPDRGRRGHTSAPRHPSHHPSDHPTPVHTNLPVTG